MLKKSFNYKLVYPKDLLIKIAPNDAEASFEEEWGEYMD